MINPASYGQDKILTRTAYAPVILVDFGFICTAIVPDDARLTNLLGDDGYG